MANKSNKILLIIPGPDSKGGVVTFSQVIAKEINLPIDYFIRGARTWPIRKGAIREAVRSISDLIRYIIILLRNRYILVQTNTSLSIFSVVRDAFFIYIADISKINTIVFFHGWKDNFEFLLEKRYLFLFRFFYFRANYFIVLSEEFRQKLIQWGYKKKIYLETTAVDDTLINDLSEKDIYQKYSLQNNNLKILFLARIEKSKGIYEALKAYSLLKRNHTTLKFLIAGDGSEVGDLKLFVKKEKIPDVEFSGFVRNQDKIDTYNTSHLYLFTSYTEGMPTSVLEAMAFGLPVVTTAVGGLVDFFVNGEHGYITDSRDPNIIAELLEKLIKDRNLMTEIAINNYLYAQENFTASQVAKRLEVIYRQFI